MKCPNCGLINPESALHCDCGYNFESSRIDEEAKLPVSKPDPPNKLFGIRWGDIQKPKIFSMIGVVWLLGIYIFIEYLLPLLRELIKE